PRRSVCGGAFVPARGLLFAPSLDRSVSMTRVIWVGVAVIGAACGRGQTGDVRAGGAHGPSGVVITGCLRPADQIGGGAIATSGSTAAAAERFVLASPTTREGMGGGGSAYMLDGDAIELRQHVDQRVEISGRVEHPEGAAAGAPSSVGSKAGAKVPGTPRLRVEAVRMVAAVCTSD